MTDSTHWHPGTYAQTTPDKPAIIVGDTGETITFEELEAYSNQVAHVLRAAGCNEGDTIALMMENTAWFLVVAWAAQRAGLYYVPVNWHLQVSEAAYVVENSEAKMLITSTHVGDLAVRLREAVKTVETFYCIDDLPGYENIKTAAKGKPATPILDQAEGLPMLYSSGTTGNPKGIKRPVAGKPFGRLSQRDQMNRDYYDFDESTVFLCPGPVYHAAPLNFCMGTIRMGATAVILQKFDAEDMLKVIETLKITHGMLVPTHFARLLRLPSTAREKYNTSSIQYAIHSAAPCPVDTKLAMIDWWGPVLHELYGGSEANGYCMIDSHDWLTHQGSVGKPVLGPIHILDLETGEELPAGEDGLIYFEGGRPFEYFGDPAKTAEAFHAEGWSTLGDIGHLDKDGYLYLTDRKSQMIISGGVNIYPQEVENCLSSHPEIYDVAVIGVPNVDFGEEVKAVVQLMTPSDGCDEKAGQLIAYTRSELAHFKCPRSVDFVEELPRLPNGKLFKRDIRKAYWPT